ncbi:MAG: transposase [Treponema sp.]|jgi:transposase|nr:transposase [Treponema sp.]
MKQKKSWEISDAFWEKAAPLLPGKERNPNKQYQRKPGGGRPPLDSRKTLEAIFYVLRTGIPWKTLPKDFGASSAVHRYFRLWCEEGFFKALWVAGLASYKEVAGIQWEWLSAGGCMTTVPLAPETAGKNLTDQGKKQQQTPYARRRCGSTPVSGGNRS